MIIDLRQLAVAFTATNDEDTMRQGNDYDRISQQVAVIITIYIGLVKVSSVALADIGTQVTPQGSIHVIEVADESSLHDS